MLGPMAHQSLAVEARRLALASVLARHCAGRLGRNAVAPADADQLVDAARSLADSGDELARRHRVRFDPPYPGATAGPQRAGERLRLVIACTIREQDGRAIGTAFTTLIAGRPVSISVAPPGAAGSSDWPPLGT
jgi:hypothetical protein